MTGPEHYRVAEQLIGMVDEESKNPDVDTAEQARLYLSAAQVHATLALAAAQVEAGRTMLAEHAAAWHTAMGRTPRHV